jgi:hypothetical protein
MSPPHPDLVLVAAARDLCRRLAVRTAHGNDRSSRRRTDDLTFTLERDAAAVRQLAVGARKHVQAASPRYPVEQAAAEHIARVFFAASRSLPPSATGYDV